MKKIIFISIALIAAHIAQGQSGRFDKCKAFGSVFFTSNKNEADFIVYFEDSEGLAELKVFQIDSPLYATKSGLWFIAEAKVQATYLVYIEKERKSMADFTVAYTSGEAFAGCSE